MKIVIDIPDEAKKAFDNAENNELRCGFYDHGGVIASAIRNGTELPKGHGRLIDADAYRKELRIEIPNSDYDGSLEPYAEGIYSAIMSLDDVPTIIEADKGETDGK